MVVSPLQGACRYMCRGLPTDRYDVYVRSILVGDVLFCLRWSAVVTRVNIVRRVRYCVRGMSIYCIFAKLDLWCLCVLWINSCVIGVWAVSECVGEMHMYLWCVDVYRGCRCPGWDSSVWCVWSRCRVLWYPLLIEVNGTNCRGSYPQLDHFLSSCIHVYISHDSPTSKLFRQLAPTVVYMYVVITCN